MAEFLHDVRCRGCRRQLGVAKVDHTIYCDRSCAEDYPASSTEGRDALVEAIYLTGKHSYAKLGEMFDFSRQWAAKTVATRDIRRV